MFKANDDFFGESDPYVTLTVGAQTKETEIIFNNCKNPIWERFFYLLRFYWDIPYIPICKDLLYSGVKLILVSFLIF